MSQFVATARATSATKLVACNQQAVKHWSGVGSLHRLVRRIFSYSAVRSQSSSRASRALYRISMLATECQRLSYATATNKSSLKSQVSTCSSKAPGREGNWRLLAQRQRRINKRLAMVSPLAARVAFQVVLVIAICEDRSSVRPLSRSPRLNTLSGSLSHRSPGPDNCSCYPLPIPCRCS
jgi:hypothetical protein